MPSESERAAALAPPRAYGAAPARAALRSAAEDFQVEEQLGFAPAGSGPHVLLRVRKVNANTAWVARELARAAGCRAHEVGYAGLKDRRAVALQWFSVPRPRQAPEWTSLRGEGYEVLEAHAHQRKLPRGALAGNGFVIRLRPASGSGAQLRAALAPRLALIERGGVPNYFGAQRFGRDGANLTPRAAPASLPAPERGFVLSAARALIFNAVLAARVRAGSWEQLLPGELANLDGSGSVFAVASLDAALEARRAALDVHPTGPLWGAGGLTPAGALGQLESEVAAAFPAQAQLCLDAGMRGERRSLRLAVRELQVQEEPAALRVSFRLVRGAFATAVLRELVDELDAPEGEG